MTEPEVIADVAPEIPVPFSHGIYSLYHLPDGGIHISFRAEGAETDEHLELPGMVIKMAEQFSSGKLSPSQIVSAFTKMRG